MGLTHRAPWGWWIELSIPRNKTGRQPTRVLFNLYDQKRGRMNEQKAEGNCHNKVTITLPRTIPEPIFRFRTCWLKRWLERQEEGPHNTMANTQYNDSQSPSPKGPIAIYLTDYAVGKENQTFQQLWDKVVTDTWRLKKHHHGPLFAVGKLESKVKWTPDQGVVYSESTGPWTPIMVLFPVPKCILLFLYLTGDVTPTLPALWVSTMLVGKVNWVSWQLWAIISKSKTVLHPGGRVGIKDQRMQGWWSPSYLNLIPQSGLSRKWMNPRNYRLWLLQVLPHSDPDHICCNRNSTIAGADKHSLR